MALAKKMKRNGRPAWDDAVIRDRIMRRGADRRLSPDFPTRPRRGADRSSDAHPALSKLLLSEISQDMSLALDIEGAYGSLYRA
jgi:hypothetical protein